MWILVIVALLLLAHVIMTWILAIKRGGTAQRRKARPIEYKIKADEGVTILIPAWNECSTIRRCLESLVQQTYVDWTAIIAAGGTDSTFQIAQDIARQDERLQVIEQTPIGKNGALADALALARGDVIIVLDADSVVTPHWLATMLSSLGGEIAAVCGNYFPIRSTWVSETEQMEKVSSYMINHQVVLQGSGSIALNREALLKSGSFPTGVSVGVDWDLDARLKEAGFMCGFTPNAQLWTERPSTLLEYWHNEVRWRRAHLAATWRHRIYYLDNLRLGLREISFYLVALAFAGSLITLVLGGLVWATTGWGALIGLAILFLLWVAGRRAAIAMEVAAYENNWHLLRILYGPVVLMFVSLAAALIAFSTPGRLPAHFQGPRDTSVWSKEQATIV